METKKILVPMLVAIFTLVLVTVGATYAYFAVGVNTNFGTSTVTAEAEAVGSVALTTGKSMSMNLTAVQMMKGSSDIPYYASLNGVKTTATTENVGVATVTGAGTYNCTYNLSVAVSGTMLTNFKSMTDKGIGQLVLSVNGQEYDLYSATLPISLTNVSMNGLTTSNPGYITASLKIVNKVDKDQSDLAGTSLTATFTPSNFSCIVV